MPIGQLKIGILPRPPRSPDISPIEDVWDIIGRKITNLPHPPQPLAALRHKVQVALDSVSQEEIDNFLRNMSRRIQECITQRGGPTHY
ncbi:DDE 3 domain containing protein [Asbolus verrucosus]|uniref:DDE 3 domain containing protein n=1 Tax=Asbolus verrucosus TaxID=1661398 RepID=A0A482W6Y7_ASBVE|nr:DDE 3 domain containing protein [Asbolus verrucosus]